MKTGTKIEVINKIPFCDIQKGARGIVVREAYLNDGTMWIDCEIDGEILAMLPEEIREIKE
jgi:hypothetical protein